MDDKKQVPPFCGRHGWSYECGDCTLCKPPLKDTETAPSQ